ncbi:MAG: nitrilase-related carbon-nitrogen hydrolase [bacterium]|nr:nitrilase-related carbon-nitrogen hydrolase [bacterium]
MKEWKMTLAQLAPALMDVRANTERALAVMYEHSRRGSSLIVLPELYLSGYAVSAHIAREQERRALKKDISEGLSRLREGGKKARTDILISYPLFEDGAEKPYIALEYIADGETLALHRKINLCNYAQYAEHLNFSAGCEVVVARSDRGSAGLFVCEDLWHVTNAIFAARLGAEVLFYPSAATVLDKGSAAGCLRNWQRLTVGTAFSQTSYVVCCNQAASGDGCYFGGSHVIAPDGELILQMPLFEEAASDIVLDGEALRAVREARPLIANERLDIYRKYI